mmetsp:Transcript_24163/g.35807  ORF Transcript_24163/g.35807 Transcript_24163/m.35807 type:complete len:366 (+) Transcript_24163:145-1242(+)|eukprot:CAMPEP_0194214184 /NCGR_PEP_ID=MMETSP0156-20130528/15319_1 /TAXON_ID=33649 /ORGANISM="Thalassionema nitzschioides, Strain L26-B" /LENGTH=365 /DNA_ID=CAMNT_0038942403 /DNA_START=63 /DNA_END=1160 /DNA_ORIENTATION=+
MPSNEQEYSGPLLDPNLWSPNENYPFILIDWNKWESLNPAPPKIYDPPQRYDYYGSWYGAPLIWWNRSCYCQPLVNLCCIPFCSPKNKTARISSESDEMFQNLLGPHPGDSSVVPEPFRNHLLWTADNNAPETLVSFNRWAWRKPKGNRVIGVGRAKYDWTNDRTCCGCLFSVILSQTFGTVQMSPDGKWFLLNSASFARKGGGNYMWLYVIQEDDEFTTPEGEVIDYVKPGDLIRLSWDGSDPYQCDNSKLLYMYFPRPVATLNEETGVITKNAIHFDELHRRATQPAGKWCETCCYACACTITGPERWDFQTQHINDQQIYAPRSPDPPTSEMIDRALGDGKTRQHGMVEDASEESSLYSFTA